jgi:hypothetical protein
MDLVLPFGVKITVHQFVSMLLHYVFHVSFCPSCVTYRYLHIYVIQLGDLGLLVGTIYAAIMDRLECVTISLTRNWLFEILHFNVAGVWSCPSGICCAWGILERS